MMVIIFSLAFKVPIQSQHHPKPKQDLEHCTGGQYFTTPSSCWQSFEATRAKLKFLICFSSPETKANAYNSDTIPATSGLATR